MNLYKTRDIGALLRKNSYPGRGIIVGLSKNGKYAVAAYFIMGRSENSRNRVFDDFGDYVTIFPYEASKLSDPSLVIYTPVRKLGRRLIVTNGDQTDTIYEHLKAGKTFEEALETREFEPDKPNFTPRISALLDFENGFCYKLSILKSADENGSGCNRFTFSYAPQKGVGHFIHTYKSDGNPLPSFVGEPERVTILNSINAFTRKIWDNLNPDNKVSLYVRYVSLASGRATTRVVNKNVRE
ncbi:MAG: IMP cyclohydrolase [Eubacteriales bacterium]|jgi:IMP cyclohydrolase